MPKYSHIVFSGFLVGLLIVGAVLFGVGWWHIIYNTPQDKISEINSFEFNVGPAAGWYTVEMDSLGAFTANNPINVSVTTTPIDLNQVHSIQLSFEGASKVFPIFTPPAYPTRPPFNATQAEWNQYLKTLNDYWNNYDKALAQFEQASRANLIFLVNDTYFPVPPELQQENVSFPEFSTFSGSLQNLTYSNGGAFNVGITVNTVKGTFGYGVGDTTYVLPNAMTISPPETMLQIESNNIITGLGWIGLGIPFLLAGLTEVLGIIKRNAFPNRKTYDGDWE
jgi:hypothetical protein